MDEQVLEDLFNRAVSQGYKKSREDFTNLLYTDQDVFNDMYSYAGSKGYQKSADEFKALIGAPVQSLKKKEPTPAPFLGGQLPSQETEKAVEAKMPEDKGFFSENTWNTLKSASKDLFGKVVQFAGEGLIADPMARAGQYGIDPQKSLEKAKEIKDLKTQAIMGGEDVLPGASIRAYGKEVQKRAKEIPYDPNTFGSIVAQAIPSVAGTVIGTGLSLIPGGATVGIPLATVSSGLGVVASIQDGRNTYTEYKKEKGLPIDLEAREATGIAYGAFEALSEKIQLDRILPKGVASQLARKMLGSIPEEILEKESVDLVRRFAESSVSRSKMAGDILGKAAKEAPIEGLSEGATTFAQELTNFAFYEEKDRKLDSDFWNELKNSFIGGAVMGGGLGPLSYGAQRSANNQRRKSTGEVVLVKNGKTGEGLEIIQDKGETISAVRPNGEVVEVQKSDLIGEPVRMSYAAFNNYLKGARSGAQVAMESENVPQVGESVSFFADRNQTVLVDKVDLSSKTVDLKYGSGVVKTVTIDQYNDLKSKAFTVESLSDGEVDYDFMSKDNEFASIDSFEDFSTAKSTISMMSMRYPEVEFSVVDNRPTPTSAPDFRIIGKTKPSAQTQQPTVQEPTGAQPVTPEVVPAQPVDQGLAAEIPVERQKAPLPKQTEEKLTEDDQGNIVFHHYSAEKRPVIKKSEGTGSRATSKEEQRSLSAVGGLAMYYPQADQKESMVGNVQHTIKVPKDKVYDADADPLGFEKEARERFEKARPGQAFDDNYRVAFITQVAGDNGFDMVVAKWTNGELRAQTTKELTPLEQNVQMKPRPIVDFKVGDKVKYQSGNYTITSVDGDNLKMEGTDRYGDPQKTSANLKYDRKKIQKVEPEPVKKEKKAPLKAIAAPFYNTQVAGVENAAELRKSDGYKAHLETIKKIADLFGIKINQLEDTIGGYQNNSGEKIVELSTVITVSEDTDLDRLEEMAAVLASMAPEVQESTIAGRYVEESDPGYQGDQGIDELVLQVGDLQGALDALKAAEIFDFTLNETEGTVTLLDFSKGADDAINQKLAKFVQQLANRGISYGKQERHTAESRFVDPGRRAEILGRLQKDAINNAKDQGGTAQNSLLDVVNEAIERDNKFRKSKGLDLIPSAAEQAKNIEESIRKAATTLKLSFPDVELITGENQADLELKIVESLTPKFGEKKAREIAVDMRSARGIAIFKDGKPVAVAINKEMADASTAAHEVWHLVLREAFGKNPKKFKEFRDSIANELINSGYEDIAEMLDNFSSQYGGDISYEEYLVEFGGLLATKGFDPKNLSTQEKTLLNKIKDIINKFSMDLIGKEVFLADADPENIIQFMSAVSEVISKGGDVRSLIGKTGKEASQADQIESLKKIDVDNVRSKDRPGKRISKGLGVSGTGSNKKGTETEGLSIDYVKEKSPKIFISNAKILSEYPLISRDLTGNPVETIEQAQEVYDLFVRKVADNLLYLVDEFKPEFREVSTLWYDGANIMANDMAEKYGLKTEQVAGIMASLSPQKDWYQNVRLAELVLMAYDTNPIVTSEMVGYQRKISKVGIYDGDKSAGKRFKRAQAAYKESKTKANKLALEEARVKLEKAINTAEKLAENLGKHVGKKLKDVPAHYQSYMIRTYHEVNTTKDYSIIRPDGQYGDLAKKNNGEKAKVAWGSYVEIGKAVSIHNNGSQENITRSLGEKHKIRNFYNNIIDPMSPDGDVTIDTHAVAAALLMALSGKAKQVGQNFGTGTSNSGPSGIQGTYYAYSDAYALAAKERGLLPRQIQSITWEAVRGLYTDKFKQSKENVSDINKIWERYADGEIKIEEARDLAKQRGGGIKDPTWAGGPLQEELGDGYESEVFSEGVDGDEQDVIGDVETVSKKAAPKNVLTENKDLSEKEKGKQGLEEILSAKERESLAKLKKAVAAVKASSKLEVDKRTKALADFMKVKEDVVKSIQAMMSSKMVIGGKEVAVGAVTVGEVNKILSQILNAKSAKQRYTIDTGGNRVPRKSSLDEAIIEAWKLINNSVRRQQIDRARANRRVAKNNVKGGKMGVLPTGGSVDQILQIDPSIIPLSRFSDYMEIINMIGQRKKVLPLEEQGALSAKIDSILADVDAENGLLEQLALAYDNYSPKEMSKRKDPATGAMVAYESFSETLKAMVKAGVISSAEADLMKRRKSSIIERMPSKGKQPATGREAISAVNSVMNAISSVPGSGARFTSYQNRILRLFRGLTRSEVRSMLKEIKDDSGKVIGYDLTELITLSKVMENLEAGYISNLSQTLSEKIDAKRKSNKIAPVIAAYKNNVLNWVSKIKSMLKEDRKGGAKKTSVINEKIRRTGNYSIDVALNNFKNSDVYNELLRPISVAIEKKDQEMQNITADIRKILNRIPDKNQFRENAMIRLINLHKMNLSDSTMPTVEEWVEATAKSKNSQYLPEVMQSIQDMMSEVSDSNGFNLQMAEDYLSDAGYDLLKKMEDIVMVQLSEKAAFGSTVIRGTRVPILEYYAATPRIVNSQNSKQAEEGIISNYTQPSSRASTFYEKKKVAHEISFDSVESTLWSAKHTLTDFYLTPEIRTSKQAIKNLLEMDFKGNQREAAVALDKVLTDSIEMVLMNQWLEKSSVEKAADFLVSKSYQAMLGGFIRPISEFISNASYAVIDAHQEFAAGAKLLLGKNKPGIMSSAVFNLGSNQLGRLFTLTGESSKEMDRRSDFSYNPIRNEVSGMRRFAKIAGNINDSFDYFSNSSLSKPDQIISRTIFFGSLSQKFNEITGLDIDLDKIAENDQEYMERYNSELKESVEFADTRVADGFSSANNFDGILRNRKLKSSSVPAVIWNNFNGFMNKFLVSEYATSVKAINAVVGNGYMTKVQGARMLAAQATRMYMYRMTIDYLGGMFYNTMSNLVLALQGIEPPEEEEIKEENKEEWYNNFARQTLSIIGALTIDRNFGNVAKVFTSIGMEYINKSYGEGITYKGEYNKYEDNVAFPFIDLDKKKGRLSTIEEASIRAAGPFSPYWKNLVEFSSQRDYYNVSIKPETKEKWKNQMELTGARTLWMATGIPMYRDINKVIQEVSYKMAKQAQETKERGDQE